MAEKTVIIIYVLSHIVSAIYMILNGKYLGEAKGISYLSLDNFTIISWLFVILIGYIFMFGFYNITRKNKPRFSFMPRSIKINNKKAHRFIFILILAQLLFASITGVGKVGSNATSSYSFIFSFFRVESIFLFYYICCRENKRFYVLNCLLFYIYRLSLGWTGFIFQYAIIEFFLYFKRNPRRRRLSHIKLLLYPSVLLLLGAKLYQYFYQLKFFIRLNTWSFKLDYFDSLTALTNRFSFFPLSVSVFQNIESIKHLYNADNMFLKEIIAMFRPLMPGFIMPYKSFRAMNNIFKQAIHYDITPTTSSPVGIFSYLVALFYSDIITGIVWIILLISLFILISSVIKTLEEKSGNLDIVYFFLILDVYNVAALEQVFSYGYLTIFYITPFLYLLGVLRNEKERRNET